MPPKDPQREREYHRAWRKAHRMPPREHVVTPCRACGADVAFSLGLCVRDYFRFKRHGDVTVALKYKPSSRRGEVHVKGAAS